MSYDNEGARRQWDRSAALYDLLAAYGPEKRWLPYKKRLFSKMEGRILFLAIGTGLDVAAFPPNQEITAIDISPRMVERAKRRAEIYAGNLTLRVMDVHELDFPDHHFDQIFTSCTFCSVPDPVRGLQALKRVLKPDGHLRMFEHTGSHLFPFNIMMHLMTPLFQPLGPAMNRDTVAHVRRAGFSDIQVTPVFLDVVKSIEARQPL